MIKNVQNKQTFKLSRYTLSTEKQVLEKLLRIKKQDLKSDSNVKWDWILVYASIPNIFSSEIKPISSLGFHTTIGRFRQIPHEENSVMPYLKSNISQYNKPHATIESIKFYGDNNDKPVFVLKSQQLQELHTQIIAKL